MAELTFSERVRKEKRRLIRELKRADCPEHKMKLLESVIQNTAWMRAKLDDVRSQIEGSDVVVDYDNGGGQKGVRENPVFKAYLSLWKNYMLGMGRILDALPEQKKSEFEKDAEAVRPLTVLEQVREKHKGAV